MYPYSHRHHGISQIHQFLPLTLRHCHRAKPHLLPRRKMLITNPLDVAVAVDDPFRDRRSGGGGGGSYC